MNDGHKPWLQRITPECREEAGRTLDPPEAPQRMATREELEVIVDALRSFVPVGRGHEYAELRKALGMEEE